MQSIENVIMNITKSVIGNMALIKVYQWVAAKPSEFHLLKAILGGGLVKHTIHIHRDVKLLVLWH